MHAKFNIEACAYCLFWREESMKVTKSAPASHFQGFREWRAQTCTGPRISMVECTLRRPKTPKNPQRNSPVNSIACEPMTTSKNCCESWACAFCVHAWSEKCLQSLGWAGFVRAVDKIMDLPVKILFSTDFSWWFSHDYFCRKFSNFFATFEHGEPDSPVLRFLVFLKHDLRWIKHYPVEMTCYESRPVGQAKFHPANEVRIQGVSGGGGVLTF